MMFFKGTLTEFSARIISVLIAFVTVFIIYFIFKKIINRNFAFLACLTSISTICFTIVTSVSSPAMMSSCLSVMSVLFGIAPLFVDCKQNEKKYFFLFWILLSMSALTLGFSAIIFPLFFILAAYLILGSFKLFIKPVNFLPGFAFFIIFIALWLLAGCKINGFDYLLEIAFYMKPKLFSLDNFSEFNNFITNFFLYCFVGIMPWFFSLCAILIKTMRNLIKYFNVNKENQFVLLMLLALLLSLSIYILYGINDFCRITSPVFFASFIVAYYWYRLIFYGDYPKTLHVSSLLLYTSLISLAVGIVFTYIFLNPMQKLYIEPLMIPIITVTLLSAIPGIIAVLLKRNIVNYSIHILLSVLLFFIMNGIFFNYVNSFGSDDLVLLSKRAEKDNAVLVTFDIGDKYVMPYYYNNSVVFNDFISQEEIFDKYGDTKNIYIILKLTDLAYFDQFFTYEVVETGKHYCEITNLKLLNNNEKVNKTEL